MSFGRVLWAAIVLVLAVAILEQYDEHLAWLLALATLAGLYLTQRSAVLGLANALAGR